MPRAVPQPVRADLVRRRQQGEPLTRIADDLGLAYRTARGLWRRYRERGPAGLEADYTRCGPPGPRYPAAVYEQVLTLKRTHPGWGARLLCQR